MPRCGEALVKGPCEDKEPRMSTMSFLMGTKTGQARVAKVMNSDDLGFKLMTQVMAVEAYLRMKVGER